MSGPRSDVLVVFGVTGDLASKKIFPALQGLVRRGRLEGPVVGVARSPLKTPELLDRVRESLEEHGGLDPSAFQRLSSRLRYVGGDYRDPETYAKLCEALGSARRPLYYLAIPPSLFATVATQLATSGCVREARVVLEKPFGRDLASARELNQILHAHFPEEALFRIDHYLGKEAVQNLIYFRFANPVVEAGWDQQHVEQVEITMAENFGVSGRGKFYEEAGAIRDVVQNHLLQVIACLAMECPDGKSRELLRDERGRLLRSIRTLTPADVVRGQFRGYRQEAGVAPESDVETFASARFQIDNPRWQGVPFFVRAGKCLPLTATEVLVKLRRPSRAVLDETAPPLGDYYRFRFSPEVVLAMGLRNKRPGELLQGEGIELLARHQDGDEMGPYERLLGDAAEGDATLFAREDSVLEAWRIVDPVLGNRSSLSFYEAGTWGPPEAGRLVAPEGGWHDPTPEDERP
jgi:glucose-6-phosphate 1-dehydrogenase